MHKVGTRMQVTNKTATEAAVNSSSRKMLAEQESNSWEGYLIDSQSSTTYGVSTVAQDLMRKRYLGISGSNKLVGAMEVQQVSAHVHVPQ